MQNNPDSIDLIKPSDIEQVDLAIFEWADKELNLSCTTKDGFTKIPVLWVSPERAYQIKNENKFRDVNGTLIPPLLTVERTGISKELNNRGSYYASVPPKNNRIVIAEKINQEKTANFTNADALRKYKQVNFRTRKEPTKTVYQYKSILLPIYATFTYSLTFMTQYQQQMNELIQPFITRTGSNRYFIVKKDGNKYECYIEAEISQDNNVANMTDEERRYISKVTIKVLGNMIGNGVNQEDSLVKTVENAVEVKIPRENLTFIEEEKRKTPRIQNLASNAGIALTSGFAVKKVFSIGNGNDEQYVITHGLSTRDMYVSVRENFGDFTVVQAGIVFNDLNTILVDMGFAIDTNSYVVTIIG